MISLVQPALSRVDGMAEYEHELDFRGPVPTNDSRLCVVQARRATSRPTLDARRGSGQLGRPGDVALGPVYIQTGSDS